LVAAHMHVGVRDRVLEGGQRLVVLPEHLERAEVVGDGQLPLAHLGWAAGSRVEGVGHSSPSASFPPARTCACTWKTVWPASGPVLNTRRKSPLPRSAATCPATRAGWRSSAGASASSEMSRPCSRRA